MGLVMAILTLPAEAAQAIANRLVDVGIRAILNYAPVQITLAGDGSSPEY